MLRRMLDYGLLMGGGLILLILLAGMVPALAQAPSDAKAQLTTRVVDKTRSSTGRSLIAIDPVVMGNSRLAVIRKVDVPAQHDGTLWVIGTELKPGEQVPENHRVITVKVGGVERKYRELKEGDIVEEGQLLGQLDNRLAHDDVAIAEAKITASEADFAASEKTREETYQRWQTAQKLFRGGKGTISEEDYRGAKLTWERYLYEATSKKEATQLAKREKNKAGTTLEMHEIRAPISGVIKTLYHPGGEAVKNLEPVLHLQNLDRLRAEGLVEVQYLPHLQLGMEVVIEPSRPEMPEQTLFGHIEAITGVAISKNKDNPLIVSSSDDDTVRVWSRSKRFAIREYVHPASVKAVACTPPTAESNLCLSAGADGVARIFDLDSESPQPLRELRGEHKGAITCVAFSPDGKTCATGGEDRTICIWDVAAGTLRYRLPSSAHRGGITALSFTPQSQLVSVSKDTALRIWALNAQGAQPLGKDILGRSGDVPQLGISADGKKVLFDKGRELYLLSLPGGETQGVLQNPTGSDPFTKFAVFSPDGQLALTAAGMGNRVQLWRLPTDTARGYEIRQWVSPERTPVTCAAISPDGTFGVTGTKDRQVYVWAMPKKEEIDQLLTAKITYIERSVESSARQVKIWAEFDNSKIHLLPGTSATMVAYPHK